MKVRKRKKLKPPTTESLEDWNRYLTSENLSANRAKPPQFKIDGERVQITTFVGNIANLSGVSEEQFRKKLGKVSPSGHRPE